MHIKRSKRITRRPQRLFAGPNNNDMKFKKNAKHKEKKRTLKEVTGTWETYV